MCNIDEKYRTEYPRPQFVRENWLNLNGVWEFDYDDNNVGISEKWYKEKELCKKINVPFCYESKLSGIEEYDFHDVVWYKREFTVPKQWEGKRLVLHFGAVDYKAEVWVNGEKVASHEGGHTPFSAEITHVVKDKNIVVVRAEDPSFDMELPRGKQYWHKKSKYIFYTRTTGIWQTVWLEALSQSYLNKVKFTPDIDTNQINIEYFIDGYNDNLELEMNISFNEKMVVKNTSLVTARKDKVSIFLDSVIVFDSNNSGALWSPEHPYLYDITFILKKDGKEIDKVESYFAMRKVSIQDGNVMLNNRRYYLKMVLDQGYFPDGLLTAPSDEALKNDVEMAKAMGFNGARKHQKIEDPRYLYWCDKLGLIVWSEMANAYMYSNEAVERVTREWLEIIDRDYNHPCIMAWIPINESWGVDRLLKDERQQKHTEAMYYLTKSLDSTRLVSSNDGWEHTISDLCTIHDYEPKKDVLKDRYSSIDSVLESKPAERDIYIPGYDYKGQPIIVSEFGGISLKKSEWDGWGYSGAENDEDFINRYNAVVSALLESPLVKGFCYTQLTDVEQELNGLLTYDRKPKVDLEIIKEINEGKYKK